MQRRIGERGGIGTFQGEVVVFESHIPGKLIARRCGKVEISIVVVGDKSTITNQFVIKIKFACGLRDQGGAVRNIDFIRTEIVVS